MRNYGLSFVLSNRGLYMNKVRELRKQRGLTQTELAEKAGLSGKSYVCEIEKGNTVPNIIAGLKSAKALRASPFKVWGLMNEPN